MNKLVVNILSKKFARELFKLPDLGEKIKDGAVKKMFVKEGSVVKEFDLIAEVATDKATAEITSPFSGTVTKIYVNENEICNVGEEFFEIETDSEIQPIVSNNSNKTKSKTIEKGNDIKKDFEARIRTTLNQESVSCSPAVRSLAKEIGIDLNKVKPSGKEGRILKEDIYNFQNQIPNKIQPFQTDISNSFQVYKMSHFEKGMVKSMTYSTSVPHFNLFEEVEVDQLLNLKDNLKKLNVHVTLFSLIIKTFSIALENHSKLNSTYKPDEDKFCYYLNQNHNITIAIDSSNGLVAPNIKNVQNKSVLEINNEIKQLREMAIKGKMTSSELENGTIALSNIGSIAGHYATPLNIPGQVCIVALGKVITRPIYEKTSQTFIPKRILPISFGCDHRVLDGATVARFALKWKEIIETPDVILVSLK